MAEVVAVLGTGIMGAPMARNLLKAGFAVRAWNRSADKAAPLAGHGASVVGSPAEAARGADFVLTMLIDADAVAQTMAGDEGALSAMGPDCVWLQCSTVGVEGNERLAGMAADAGVAFVDTPVLGTRQPAEQGKLNVLASGPRALEARCRPVLEAVGQKVAWLGEAGTGSRLKLVMNSWVLAVVGAVAEAVALAEGLGLDPKLFLDTLDGSQIDTPYAHLKAAAMIARDYPPAFPTAGALKDAGLILDAARSCGVSADVAAAMAEKFRRAVEAGHGDEDMAAAFSITAPS